MKGKILSLLLAICLVASMMPAMTQTASAAETINNIRVTGVKTPVDGDNWREKDAYQKAESANPSRYQVNSVTWLNGDGTAMSSDGEKFKEGRKYIAVVKIKTTEGTELSDKLYGFVNGEEADVIRKISDSEADLRKTFTAAKAEETNDCIDKVSVDVTAAAGSVSGIMYERDHGTYTVKIESVTGADGKIVSALEAGKAYKFKFLFDAKSEKYFASGTVSGQKDAPTPVFTITFNGEKQYINTEIIYDEKVCGWEGAAGERMYLITEYKIPVKAVSGITLDSSAISLNEGETRTLTATVAPADATNKNVVWVSSDPSVATVSAAGIVTAVKAGTAKITATTEDQKKTAECTVTVATVYKTFADTRIGIEYKSVVYSGSSKEPDIVILNQDNTYLVKGTDYTVEYSNNKNVGTAAAVITGTGRYRDSAVMEFKIVPKAVTIKSFKKKSAGKLTVKWASHKTQTTGFQIRYSTSKKFTSYKSVTVSSKSATSKLLKGLKKGKTYYVKMRAYKTVDGNKIYSAWSKSKKAKA